MSKKKGNTQNKGLFKPRDFVLFKNLLDDLTRISY